MVDLTGINTQANQANRVTERAVSKGTGAKANEPAATPSPTDRIEISAGAKEAQTISNLVQLAQAESDMRPAVVAQAKEKLEQGEYEGIEASRQAAQKILGV
ncbi:MAG: flagellar biosynthesis anti-sigma factor FlgM [bacterium]